MEEQHSDDQKKPDEREQARSEEDSTDEAAEGMDGYGSVEQDEKEAIDHKEVLSNPG